MDRINNGIIWGAMAVAFVASLWVQEAVFNRAPVTTDEHSYLFQAHLLSAGKLKDATPPFPEMFFYPMIITDEAGWLSRYPPGHAMWLLLGLWMGNAFWSVAVAAALGVWVMARVAYELRPSRAAVVAAVLLCLGSPFYLYTHGTLLSHVSGQLAVGGMLLAYILWHTRDQPRWAVVAGLAWSWLFLNRTYTALLIAIPFGVDALWHLGRRRDGEAVRGVGYFVAASAVGVVAIMAYNWATVGHPLLMTYLHYDPSDRLGFGLRHDYPVFPAPQPVDHTWANGWGNLVNNLRLMDRWLWGIPGGLLIWLALVVVGWSRRWTPLLAGSAISVWFGYVLFWYEGVNEVGPNYYVEVLPVVIASAVIGVVRLWQGVARYPVLRGGVCVLVPGLWAMMAWPFWRAEGVRLYEDTYPRREILDLYEETGEKRLIFSHMDVVNPAWDNHDLVVNPRGLRAQTIVARWLPLSVPALCRLFPAHAPYKLERRDGRYVLEPMPDADRLDHMIWIRPMHRRTGTNWHHPETPGEFVRVATAEDPANWLLFGASFRLYPGRFVLELEVEAEGERVATVDLSSNSGRMVLAQADVSGTGERRIVEVPVDNDDYRRVEPRVYYNGGGAIRIYGMRIRDASVTPAAQSTD